MKGWTCIWSTEEKAHSEELGASWRSASRSCEDALDAWDWMSSRSASRSGTPSPTRSRALRAEIPMPKSSGPRLSWSSRPMRWRSALTRRRVCCSAWRAAVIIGPTLRANSSRLLWARSPITPTRRMPV